MTTAISREELAARLRREERVAIVEALGPAFYADAHLPGAVNIPPDQVDRLSARLLPDPTAEVVVYCSATCENSEIVAQARPPRSSTSSTNGAGHSCWCL